MGLPLLILTLGVLLGLGEGHQDHPHLYGPPKTHPDTAQVWLQTMGAALGVSLAPHLVLLLLPADSGSPRRRGLLRLLLSFAAGGLLGDAFLHLIPHALAPHDHHEDHGHSHHEDHGHSHHDHGHHEDHGHSHYGHSHHEGHGHSHHDHGHHEGHGHSHHDHAHKSKHSSSEDEADGDAGDTKGTKGTKATPGATPGATKATPGATKATPGATPGATKATKSRRRRSSDRDRAGMAASGYLNLAADAAHNFTDGLALGAAFRAGPARGALTALAVLLHELPHELGDVALLLRAGCSWRQALLLQLLTALAALAGSACSLLAEGSGSSAASGLLPFTAGGFIYLGTVSVLPELLGGTRGARPALLQLLALLAGLAMMLLVALCE